MLAEFTAWLVGLVKAFFAALWSFVVDAFIGLVDLVLSALIALFALIPVPAFLSDGLASVWGQLDSPVLYLVTAAGMPPALAILGAAYLFRLTRKVVTLFQW